MADADVIIQRIVLEGAPQIQGAFSEIAAAAKEAFKGIEEAVTGFSFGSALIGIGAVAAAAAGVGVALFEWSKSAAETTHDMANLAAASGQSIEQVSGLKSALSAMGADTDNMGMAYRRLSMQIQQQWMTIVKDADSARDKLIANNFAIEKSTLAVGDSKEAVVSAQKKLLEAEAKAGYAGAQTQLDFLNDPRVLAEEAVANAKRKVQEASLAEQEAEQRVALVAKKANDDRLNSLNSLIPAIKSVADGSKTFAEASRGANLTITNVLKGVIAAAGPAADELKDFHGNIGDLITQSPDARATFLMMADFMKNSGNAALNTALAFRVFGRGVQVDMIAAMKQGSGAILEIEDHMKKLGLVLTDVDETGTLAFIKAMHTLTNEMSTTFTQIGDRFFGPAFTAGFEALSKFIEDNHTAILGLASDIADVVNPVILDMFRILTGQTPKLQWVADIYNAIKLVGSAFVYLGEVVVSFFQVLNGQEPNIAWVKSVMDEFSALGAIINGVWEILKAVTQSINDFFGSNFSTVAIALGGMMALKLATAFGLAFAPAIAAALISPVGLAVAAALALGEAAINAAKKRSASGAGSTEASNMGLQVPDEAQWNALSSKQKSPMANAADAAAQLDGNGTTAIAPKNAIEQALSDYQDAIKKTTDIVGENYQKQQDLMASHIGAGADSAINSLKKVQEQQRASLANIDKTIAGAENSVQAAEINLRQAQGEQVAPEELQQLKIDQAQQSLADAKQNLADQKQKKSDLQDQQNATATELSNLSTSTHGATSALGEFAAKLKGFVYPPGSPESTPAVAAAAPPTGAAQDGHLKGFVYPPEQSGAPSTIDIPAAADKPQTASDKAQDVQQQVATTVAVVAATPAVTDKLAPPDKAQAVTQQVVRQQVVEQQPATIPIGTEPSLPGASAPADVAQQPIFKGFVSPPMSESGKTGTDESGFIVAFGKLGEATGTVTEKLKAMGDEAERRQQKLAQYETEANAPPTPAPATANGVPLAGSPAVPGVDHYPAPAQPAPSPATSGAQSVDESGFISLDAVAGQTADKFKAVDDQLDQHVAKKQAAVEQETVPLPRLRPAYAGQEVTAGPDGPLPVLPRAAESLSTIVTDLASVTHVLSEARRAPIDDGKRESWSPTTGETTEESPSPYAGQRVTASASPQSAEVTGANSINARVDSFVDQVKAAMLPSFSELASYFKPTTAPTPSAEVTGAHTVDAMVDSVADQIKAALTPALSDLASYFKPPTSSPRSAEVTGANSINARVDSGADQVKEALTNGAQKIANAFSLITDAVSAAIKSSPANAATPKDEALSPGALSTAPSTATTPQSAEVTGANSINALVDSGVSLAISTINSWISGLVQQQTAAAPSSSPPQQPHSATAEDGSQTLGASAATGDIAALATSIEPLPGVFDSLMESAQSLVQALLSAASSAGNTQNTGGGFAAGGRISGAGTGTSDSIHAMVSHGEYIVNAKSTSAFLPVLHAINGFASGGLVDWASQFALPKFATGGLVDFASQFTLPKFAAGGLVDWASQFTLPKFATGGVVDWASADFELPQFSLGGMVDGLRSSLDISGFAGGGRVNTAELATAGDGPTQHFGTVDFRTDGGTVSGTVSHDFVKSLSRAAVDRSIRSGGSKPGHFR